MTQNDTHVAPIILTTQTWWWGGIIGGKHFSGQNLCSCTFGANIRSYKTKGPTWNHISATPPPASFGGRPCHPPPTPRSNFQVALISLILGPRKLNIQICKACFGPLLCVLHLIWALGAGVLGSPWGLEHNVLMQFVTLGNSKKRRF